MRLRRLNPRGIEKLSAYLDSLKTESPEPHPEWLLEDPEHTEPAGSSPEVDRRQFANRLEAGAYLYEVLTANDVPGSETDQGLWAWLALFYFEQLCPPDRSGRVHPGERARWIPDFGNFRRRYQHLLAGPFQVYRAHRDDPTRTLALLCGSLHQVSDTYLELAKRQELITNPAVVAAATKLYYDLKKGRLKRSGARGAPGTIRRFAEVLMQLDVAWDLYSMSAAELIEMLPAEFDRFRR